MIHWGFVARPLLNTCCYCWRIFVLDAGTRLEDSSEYLVFWPKPEIVWFKYIFISLHSSSINDRRKEVQTQLKQLSHELRFHWFSTLITFPAFALRLMKNQIWGFLFFSITNLLQGWNRAKLWRKAQITPAGQIWLTQGACSLKARGIHQLLQIICISCSRHTLGEKKSV